MIDVVSRYVQLLAHELNNPLTVLYGQAALIKAQLGNVPVDTARISSGIGQVDESTSRVIRLVEEFREALREVDDEAPELVPLGDLLAQAAVFNRRLCKVHAATLEIDPIDADVLVHVRPVQTRGILWKLLARALQRSRDVRVRTHLEETKLHLVIAELTPHPGTPPELRLRVLEEGLQENQVDLRSWDRTGERGLELCFPRVD